jgi:hypothetical protein
MNRIRGIINFVFLSVFLGYYIELFFQYFQTDVMAFISNRTECCGSNGNISSLALALSFHKFVVSTGPNILESSNSVSFKFLHNHFDYLPFNFVFHGSLCSPNHAKMMLSISNFLSLALICYTGSLLGKVRRKVR